MIMKQHLLKNTYAAIVALFIAMMALPTTAQAQTKYDLKICGTQVTSDNCGDLSGIYGVEGTVKYDPDSKTLTLEGAKLTASICIWSKIDGLTIKVRRQRAGCKKRGGYLRQSSSDDYRRWNAQWEEPVRLCDLDMEYKPYH